MNAQDDRLGRSFFYLFVLFIAYDNVYLATALVVEQSRNKIYKYISFTVSHNGVIYLKHLAVQHRVVYFYDLRLCGLTIPSQKNLGISYIYLQITAVDAEAAFGNVKIKIWVISTYYAVGSRASARRIIFAIIIVVIIVNVLLGLFISAGGAYSVLPVAMTQKIHDISFLNVSAILALKFRISVLLAGGGICLFLFKRMGNYPVIALISGISYISRQDLAFFNVPFQLDGCGKSAGRSV